MNALERDRGRGCVQKKKKYAAPEGIEENQQVAGIRADALLRVHHRHSRSGGKTVSSPPPRSHQKVYPIAEKDLWGPKYRALEQKNGGPGREGAQRVKKRTPQAGPKTCSGQPREK